jgi:hypothetical protein
MFSLTFGSIHSSSSNKQTIEALHITSQVFLHYIRIKRYITCSHITPGSRNTSNVYIPGSRSASNVYIPGNRSTSKKHIK